MDVRDLHPAPDAAWTESVSWRQVTLPTGGGGTLAWTTAIDVCLASVTNGPPRVYKTTQLLAADIGTAWHVQSPNTVLQLVESSDPPLLPNTVQIENQTTSAVNIGYGQSSAAAVFAPAVPGNVAVAFYPVPTYSLMLATSVVSGQVITSGSAQQQTSKAGFIPPQRLVFPIGVTTATATATMDGSSILVTITYGHT